MLPNSTVANISQNSHSDLYFALRGGGNNFGIVTGFIFRAHQGGLIWGGTNVYLMEDLHYRKGALGLRYGFRWTLHSATMLWAKWLYKLGVGLGYGVRSTTLIRAFVDLANNEDDPSPHAYCFLAWIPYMKSFIIGTTATYSEPVERPKILHNLTLPSGIMSSNRFAHMSDFAREIDKTSPNGERWVQYFQNLKPVAKHHQATLAHSDLPGS